MGAGKGNKGQEAQELPGVLSGRPFALSLGMLPSRKYRRRVFLRSRFVACNMSLTDSLPLNDSFTTLPSFQARACKHTKGSDDEVQPRPTCCSKSLCLL